MPQKSRLARLPALAAAGLLTACVGGDLTASTIRPSSREVGQAEPDGIRPLSREIEQAALAGAVPSGPRTTAFRCGAAGTLTVENSRTSVFVVPPDGIGTELPAAPPAQASSFRAGGSALELDGDTAVFTREGQDPLRCKRQT